MEKRHLQSHDKQYRVFLYVFYACAIIMTSILVYGVYAMMSEWSETGYYVMGEVLVQTQIPFENFANLLKKRGVKLIKLPVNEENLFVINPYTL